MSAGALVSVVIPTYNRRRSLGRAIDAVLSQEHDSLELIVVDDASSDGTADWVAAAYPDVRLIRNPANRGVSAARNAGLAAGRGEFVAFLDDDDWWDPAFLRRHLALLASRPEAILSYCNFTSVAADGGAPLPGTARGAGADPVEDFLMGNPIPSLTLVVMRMAAAKEARGFREDYVMCEDRELYLRLLARGPFIHSPGAWAFKTRSADSMTLNVAVWEAWTQTLLTGFFSSEASAPYRRLERTARARWKARLAMGCFRRLRAWPLGLGLVASALRSDPAGAARYIAERARDRIKRS